MIQLIALDFDGTLVPKGNPHAELDDEVLKLLHVLKEKGVYLMIATGRHPSFIRKRIKSFTFERIIGYSGNMIDSSERYDLKLFSKEIIHQFYMYFTKQQMECVLYSCDAIAWYSTQVIQKQAKKRLLNKKSIVDLMGVADELIEDYLRNECQQPICRICVKIEDWKQAEGIKTAFHNTFPQYRLVKTGNKQVEILHINVSKGSEILKVAQDLGISKENIAAIGDDENDEEMLRMFPYSYYVGDENPYLQQAAANTAHSCKEALCRMVNNIGENHD